MIHTHIFVKMYLVVYRLASVVCTLVTDFACQLYSTFHCQLVVDVICCTRCFWCRLVQRTKCQCKAVKDSMSWKSMQEKRAQSSARVIAGFRMADWYGVKNWSGFDTITWLIQQKIAMRTIGKSGKFLEAEEKRIFLFSHLLCSLVSAFQ